MKEDETERVTGLSKFPKTTWQLRRGDDEDATFIFQEIRKYGQSCVMMNDEEKAKGSRETRGRRRDKEEEQEEAEAEAEEEEEEERQEGGGGGGG